MPSSKYSGKSVKRTPTRTKRLSFRSRVPKIWVLLIFILGFGGIGAYMLYAGQAASGVQIYRGVRNDGADHYLSEVDTPADSNYQIEGPIFWAYPSQESGTLGVTRWWNGTYGAHYYSDGVHSSPAGDGWTSEGVRFYVPSGPGPHAIAVYVARNPNNQDRVYSADENEINGVIASGWVDKSLAFYALDSNPANWGPADNYTPTGNLDGPTPVTNCGNVGVWGWAKDDDYSGAVEVHLYIDNQGPTAITAGDNRGDVGAHGFNWAIPQGNFTKAGTHTVKAYAINYNSVGWNSNSKNTLIGQKSYTCPSTATTSTDNSSPTGNLDEARCDQGMWGWAKDNDYNGAIQVHIYGDNSTEPFGITAGDDRGDVGAHGFNWDLPNSLKTNGTHTIRVYAINYSSSGLASNSKNALIGEKTYTCGSSATPPPSPGATDVAPTGKVDDATCEGVWGWAYDANQKSTPLQVHIYVDGKLITGVEASRERTDVAAAYPGVSAAKGFEYKWSSYNKTAGTHNVQVYALNLDPSGQYASTLNALLPGDGLSYNCGTSSTPSTSSATNDYAPGGNVDGISCTGVWGWTYDKDSSGASIQYHVYVDNVLQYGGVTTTARPDVNAAYNIKGTHGFEYNLPDNVKTGEHTVNIYGIDINSADQYDGGAKNALIGGTKLKCSEQTLTQNRIEAGSTFDPSGKVDVNNCKTVSGWAFDPDAKDKAIDIHVYIDGQGTPLGPTSFARTDVNDAYKISGSHGYTFDVPTSYLDDRLHAVTVYALGVDNLGEPSGSNPVIGQARWACDSSGNPIVIKPVVADSGGNGGAYCPKSGPTLRVGSTDSAAVSVLQNCLAVLELHGGKDNGVFSDVTKDSVYLAQLAVPADYGFAQYARYEPGVVDNSTYGILAYAESKSWTASNPTKDTGSDVNREGLPTCDLGYPESCIPPATINRDGEPTCDPGYPESCIPPRVVVSRKISTGELTAGDPDGYLLLPALCYGADFINGSVGRPVWRVYDHAATYVNYYDCLSRANDDFEYDGLFWDGKESYDKIWERGAYEAAANPDGTCKAWFKRINEDGVSYFSRAETGTKNECIDAALGYKISGDLTVRVFTMESGKIKIVEHYDALNESPDHVTWDVGVVVDFKTTQLPQ